MGLKTAGVRLCFQGGLLNATVYVALHTADPDATNEEDGAGYARAAVAPAGWTVDASSGRASNGARIDFPDPTGDWGDSTHVALWSAETGGDLLFSGALSEDVEAPAGRHGAHRRRRPRPRSRRRLTCRAKFSSRRTSPPAAPPWPRTSPSRPRSAQA